MRTIMRCAYVEAAICRLVAVLSIPVRVCIASMVTPGIAAVMCMFAEGRLSCVD